MKNLIFLDTETTGKEGRIIQIACFVNDGNQTDVFEQLFKPPVPIEIESMTVHHITEKIIKDKPTFDSFRSRYEQLSFKENLQKNLYENILVCHNVAFDSAVLEREGLKVGERICTMKVAQTIWDYPQYKLQYLRYALNLEIEGEAHDAKGDVQVLIKIFDVLLDNIMCNEHCDREDAIERMIEITSKPVLLRTLPFGKYRGQKFADIKDRSYFQWMLGTEIGEDLRHTLNYYLLK